MQENNNNDNNNSTCAEFQSLNRFPIWREFQHIHNEIENKSRYESDSKLKKSRHWKCMIENIKRLEKMEYPVPELNECFGYSMSVNHS